VIVNNAQRAIRLALLLFLVVGAIATAFAAPEGIEEITILSSERRTPSVAKNITAQGGNITRLNISASTQTIAWQGFAGNISGSIVLDDASGDRFYRWNLTNISGEIYASRNSTLVFTSIFAVNDCTVDESLTGTRADRVNRTYSKSSNFVNFSVGAIAINTTTACAAYPFVNSSLQSSAKLFQNAILTPDGNLLNGSQINNSIYAGILQDFFVAGFDFQHYNFQLLVPVNRTSSFNTYAIYAELD
jgi:hypothetical protein